jgi:hypothetical protein
MCVSGFVLTGEQNWPEVDLQRTLSLLQLLLPSHGNGPAQPSNRMLSHVSLPPARRQPVSKQLFLKHFWWCHSRLADKADAEYGMAAYFRFLTLVGDPPATRKPHVADS